MLSKDCKVLQSFYIKKKSEKVCKCCKCRRVFIKQSEKFANVTEPTNMAEFFTNVAEFAVLSNVANIAGSLRLCRCCKRLQKKKKEIKKKHVMLQNLQ